MKKWCIVWIGLFTMIFSLKAQIVEISEIEAESFVYIKEESKYAFSIRNKENSLRNIDPYFIEYAQLGGKLPEIVINNKEELDVYVRVFIAPYFKGTEREFRIHESFSVSIYCDLLGNIQELDITYPKIIEIPITAIEQFEKAIITSSLRLVFDKTFKAFAASPWVGRYYIFNPETLLEMAP